MSATVWPPAAVSVTDSAILTALRAALAGFLPAGVEIIRAQINRVPEPATADFVVMTPILRRRLETNVDDWYDIILTAAIDAKTTDPDTGAVLTPTTMTVSATNGAGPLIIGNPLSGPGIARASAITAFISGTGGTGTYLVTPDQEAISGIIYAGYQAALVQTEATVQLDVHGPASAENAQIIMALLRDEVGTDAFAAAGPSVTTLYASDPRQVPFVNAEDAWEYRYIVEAVLQASIVITTGQQFAAALSADLIDVDTYPA